MDRRCALAPIANMWYSKNIDFYKDWFLCNSICLWGGFSELLTISHFSLWKGKRFCFKLHVGLIYNVAVKNNIKL